MTFLSFIVWVHIFVWCTYKRVFSYYFLSVMHIISVHALSTAYVVDDEGSEGNRFLEVRAAVLGCGRAQNEMKKFKNVMLRHLHSSRPFTWLGIRKHRAISTVRTAQWLRKDACVRHTHCELNKCWSAGNFLPSYLLHVFEHLSSE